jgi:glycosyltransferase involved in cell wall biosynthesis
MSAHNASCHLESSIESMLKQTFKDFEFIVVNDGSTDSTLNILDSYRQKDNRIKIIVNTRNIGLTKSLNEAIRMAKGEYIARMDADDIALPERLENQVNFLDKNPDVGMVGTAYYEMDSKGKIVGEKVFPTTDKKLRDVLIRYNPFFHGSVMIRKEVFDRVGLYNENIPKAQDYELWFRIARNYKIANLPLLLMMRRYSKRKTLVGENEQIKWAINIRVKYIKKGQYPLRSFFYLLRPFMVYITPPRIRLFMRQKVLGRNIYNY